MTSSNTPNGRTAGTEPDPRAPIEVAHANALEMARDAMSALRDDPLIWYFDRPITGAELATDADALACALAARGVGPGDRVALYLQNVPQMVTSIVAVWTIGAIVVPMNPMLREREVTKILADSGAVALIALEELYDDVARHVIADTPVTTAITTSPFDALGGDVPPVLAKVRRVRADGVPDLRELIEEHAGQAPPAGAPGADDVALLVYTSGTTGPAKGAMVLHRNFVFSSNTFRQVGRLGREDINIGLAPLFHITGLLAGPGASWAALTPLLLNYRFEPATVLGLVRLHRPTFTVAAITAFTALLEHPDFAEADLSCVRAAFSGGAPVPPATVARWEEATGRYVHNCYGLTETTSATHMTPLGARAPVDPTSGTLSVGLAVPGTSVEILGDDGTPLPPGEIGEIATKGPQVVPGYWHKPEETANAFRDGRVRTGDVGFRDEEGWFYLVDRSKDMIVAAGYKVWPREVEDVLYEHPSVREAAVIGVPDAYRGETVKAFVSLRAGTTATPEELMAFSKQRMAAYKYPREIEIRDELPKTVTGKILRRTLRDESAPGA
jgi:long-chain acyl-CoA synthetase